MGIYDYDVYMPAEDEYMNVYQCLDGQLRRAVYDPVCAFLRGGGSSVDQIGLSMTLCVRSSRAEELLLTR